MFLVGTIKRAFRFPVHSGRAFLLCVLCLFPQLRPSAASGAEADRPVVVVLRMAEDGANAFAEERFVTELALALNRFRVLPLRDPSGRFAVMSFVERLELVRSLSKQHGAVATVWVERWAADKLVLNLTAMSTGRALVKIVEVKSGPSQEAELALVAEALLGEAYLFSSAQREDAVREKVEEVRQAATRNDSVSGVTSGLSLFGTVLGALTPRTGSSLLVGGGLAWMTEFRSGWFLSPGLFGFGGPKERYDDGFIGGWGLQGELQVGVHFRFKKAAVGPALGAGVRYQQIESFFGSGPSTASTLVSFRGSVSLNTQVSLARDLAIFCRLDLGLLSNSADFKRVSNENSLLETPLFDGGVMLGFRYMFLH